MAFFVRIITFVKSNLSFLNLTSMPTELFSNGNAVCTAKTESSLSPSKVVFSYGPFSSKKEAAEESRKLNRLIKLHMISRDIATGPYDQVGVLDNPNMQISYYDLSKWEHIIESLPERYRKGACEQARIENECAGIGIYEVKKDLDEISFFEGKAQLSVKATLEMQHQSLSYWDESMDVCLALLNASMEACDLRTQFLLRIMSLESLLSNEQLRDEQYQNALEAVQKALVSLVDNKLIREQLQSQLGNLRRKSVREKANECFSEYLPGKTYAGKSPIAFFSQCYSARSQLVHSGTSASMLFDLSKEIKNLLLDLLYSKANSVSIQ